MVLNNWLHKLNLGKASRVYKNKPTKTPLFTITLHLRQSQCILVYRRASQKIWHLYFSRVGILFVIIPPYNTNSFNSMQNFNSCTSDVSKENKTSRTEFNNFQHHIKIVLYIYVQQQKTSTLYVICTVNNWNFLCSVDLVISRGTYVLLLESLNNLMILIHYIHTYTQM